MSQPKVVIEVRLRLQSCQVYYQVDKGANNHLFNIDVQPSSITFKCDMYEEQYFFESIKLKPVFINDVKPDEDNVITCRLQTLVSIGNGECKNKLSKYVPNVDSGKSVEIKCRCCQANLINNNTSFERVLPLPSSDLSSGDLFCHPCSGNNFTDGKIQPKPRDLLYGNYFFTINNELLCESKIFSVRDTVYCKQCRTWIGTKDNVSTKMWNCTVGFDNQSEPEVSAQDDFICALKNALDDWLGLGVMCKVIVTYKPTSLGSSEYLLLWVMDRSLTLLISSDDSKRLVQKSAIKLLYSHEKSDSEVVPEWQKDTNTHFMDIAEVMFTEGLNYLEQTNSLFPNMFRKANNMNVGYLDI